ncbi:MAG TPA: alkaline phosphatase family protein [Longimicrobiales bacterium]
MRSRNLHATMLSVFALWAAACGAGPAAGQTEPAPRGGDPAMRTLVLMLDGVPFGVMDSLWRAGHFAGFRPPSRVISPFPALTQVSFGSIWREPPTGYEDRYFDPSENRLEGGLLDHLLKPAEHAGFRRHVDVEPGGIAGTFAYLLPGPMAGRELDRLREQILERAAHDTVVVAYLVSTDALAHRAGREEVVRYLIEVEALLAELRSRFGEELEIVLFSDHGNEMIPTRRAPLEQALEAGGFDLAGEIEDENDVVTPRFGLVGSAFFYTWPSAESRLAEVLRGAEGVELVMFDDTLRRVHVWSRDGRAIVEASDDGGRLRYTPVDGDPLGLVPALEALRRNGLLDADGFAPDSAWLHASRETPYIDSLRRIVVGMRGLVRYPASVVVSFAPGYHFGSRAADLLVDVTGTHGSLRTESAMAFLMTTGDPAPTLVRSDALLRYVPVSRDVQE